MAKERIEEHIFHFITQELYDFPLNKSLVADWEKESREIASETASPLGQDNTRFSQNKISNPTSAKAMRLLSMAAKVDRARWYVRAIENVLETLPEIDRRLVEEKYFRRLLTNAGVARELSMNQTTFYERRNILIEKFGRRMGLL